jgi:hypothetical protein
VSRALYSDAFVTITLDEPSGLIRYVRSGTGYPSVEDARLIHARILGALPVGAPSTRKLLVDLRQASSRNDDAFETVMMEIMSTFLPQFGTIAYLVKTAAGRLQMRRLSGARASMVFDDEREALRHLGAAT